MNEIKQIPSTGIEGFSEALLDRFDRFGAVLDTEAGEVTSRTVEGSTGALLSRGVQDYLHHQQAALQQAASAAADESWLSRTFTGALGKIPEGLGRTLEATTGIMNVARQFHRDREAGDKSLSGTMRAAFTSVAQISAGQACGWLAGAAVAPLTGVAAVPIIVGTGVAIGAQYLIGKLFGRE